MTSMIKYNIAVGRSRLDLKWVNKSVSWEELTSRLARCTKTEETVAEYSSLSKERRGSIKDIGGFVGGSLVADGPRKSTTIASRTLLTLDIDYARADTLGVLQDMMAGTAWCLYSTHSHTPAAPRYRLIVPLDRAVTPDEYIPIARRVADNIGIDVFDDSTYQPERLMYWPSRPLDGEYVFEQGEGDELSADDTLSTYVDWSNVAEWPISSRVQRLTRPGGKKLADPGTKPGIIGAFCRVYGIEEAIETYLPDVYEKTDIPGRWTYLKGSTTGGAVVYEDRWLYSHHGTDPCCEKEVNAFDLVRIHKFSELDSECLPDTPVNRLKSFEAMTELANTDRRVSRESSVEAFKDMTGMTDEEYEGRSDELGWVGSLRMDERRKYYLPCSYNYDLLLRNDPLLKDTVKYNIFLDKNEIQRDLPWAELAEDHLYWTDADDNGLISYVSEKYPRMQMAKTTLLDSHDLAMWQAQYHPIREYLKSLSWDGIERVESLLIDYLGAVDDPDGLTRAMTRKHMVAAVARVFKPGVKYDYVLTLTGPEGIGKSTLLKKLGRKWFNDSFSSADIGDKQAMEQIRGTWINELAELSAYKRNVVDSFKAFISKTEDEYRPAYGRKKVTIKRQCVFWATTNETTFLKGDTGNRRFWVVRADEDLHNLTPFDLTDEDIDQIWAEAVELYRKGEPLWLGAEMEALARKRQQEYNEDVMDTRPGVIDAFIRRLLPETWKDKTKEQRADWFKTYADGSGTARRKYICAVEIANECFHRELSRYEAKEINRILDGIEGLVYVGSTRVSDCCYGGQKRYKITDSFWSKSAQL